MINGMIARKLGMTQLFDQERGIAIPVTVLEVGPCPVVQVKTQERDGYEAVQVGFGARKEKHVTKPMKGHYGAAKVAPARVLREFQPSVKGKLPELASSIDVSIFEGVKRVDVVGTSKGRGFAGVHKRHGMAGGPDTHGSMFHRRTGSLGMRMWPGRVDKGKKMPGHMGNVQVTVKGLEVERIDRERNLLFVKGSVPGPRTGVVLVYAGEKK